MRNAGHIYYPSKRTIATLVVVLAAVIIVFFLFSRSDTIGQQSKTVVITNLDSCTPNISPTVQQEISTASYALVKSANNYNKTESLPKYTATIRAGSCMQESQNTVTDYNDSKQVVKTTSVILDTPDAKQSWKISFDWVTDKKVNTDLGTITPECLPAESLIYGDFNCYKIMSLREYGTDNYDAILQYMPYTGSGFDLSYDPDTKQVTATINIPEWEKDNQELLSNRKDIVLYWFEHRGLDINNYTVIYKTSYQ